MPAVTLPGEVTAAATWWVEAEVDSELGPVEHWFQFQVADKSSGMGSLARVDVFQNATGVACMQGRWRGSHGV